jgi:hypothetical protein
MITGSTRTDGLQDGGIADMGFHHALDSIRFVPGAYNKIWKTVWAAKDGDVVLVRPGTYVENIDFFGKSVILRSDKDGDPNTRDLDPGGTVIDGNQSGSVVYFGRLEERDAVIEGFTITNGSGTMDWIGSVYGGGLFCERGADPIIRDNIITGNTAGGDHGKGGGICCHWYSHAVIARNLIYNNLATAWGGGICVYQLSYTKIYNNVIYENASLEDGGGLYLYGSDPKMRRGRGENDLQVYHNTVVDNWAGEYGGGFSLVSVWCDIRNSIVWGNEAPNSPQIYEGWFTEAHISFCDVEGGYSGYLTDHIIDQDPLFADPKADDYHITRRSPCINRGANEFALADDFDGNERPYMGTADMGADEFMETHLLEAEPFVLSEAVGGTVAFTLEAGTEKAGKTYLMLGSVTGTIPGNLLPGGEAILPLNWDPFTNLIIAFLNSPIFFDFTGTLDASGSAQALFDTLGPMPSGLAGLCLSFAYAVRGPWDLASNPIQVEVIP